MVRRDLVPAADPADGYQGDAQLAYLRAKVLWVPERRRRLQADRRGPLDCADAVPGHRAQALTGRRPPAARRSPCTQAPNSAPIIPPASDLPSRCRARVLGRRCWATSEEGIRRNRAIWDPKVAIGVVSELGTVRTGSVAQYGRAGTRFLAPDCYEMRRFQAALSGAGRRGMAPIRCCGGANTPPYTRPPFFLPDRVRLGVPILPVQGASETHLYDDARVFAIS